MSRAVNDLALVANLGPDDASVVVLGCAGADLDRALGHETSAWTFNEANVHLEVRHGIAGTFELCVQFAADPLLFVVQLMNMFPTALIVSLPVFPL